MNRQREIHMMDDELTKAGATVIFQGTRCVTVQGDHHDFKTLAEVHAYLTGCLVFAYSRSMPFDTVDTQPIEGVPI